MLYDDVEKYVKALDAVRAADLQLKFRVGYSRGNRLIAQLQENGIIETEMTLYRYNLCKQQPTKLK